MSEKLRTESISFKFPDGTKGKCTYSFHPSRPLLKGKICELQSSEGSNVDTSKIQVAFSTDPKLQAIVSYDGQIEQIQLNPDDHSFIIRYFSPPINYVAKNTFLDNLDD